MANTWFRMYSEFANDPKVQTMSESMQRRLAMLFCLQCSESLVPLTEDELAFALHISADDLSQTKKLFIRKGFVDAEWCLVNWDKRQFASDSSTERTRRHRERKREQSETSQNGSGSALEQNRTDTEQNRTDGFAVARADAKTESPPISQNSASKKPVEEKAIVLSKSRFGDFWTAWSLIRGTAKRTDAAMAWLSYVPDTEGDAAIACTSNYLASLDPNSNKGYNPENFLREIARDKFQSRYPSWKSNGRAGPTRKEKAMQEFMERMADEKRG